MSLTKPTLSNLRAAGTTVGDVYFPQTELLLPFDGSNGATTTSDLSNTNASVTFSSGDEIRTAQSKFGNSSLYVADNVTISSSDGFNMGTGEFTIEGWWYFTSFSNGFSLYDQWSSGSSGNSQIWHGSSAAGKIKWYYDGGSVVTSNTTMSTGQWYHIAFVRESGTLKMYFNGTVDSNTQSFLSQYGKTDTVYLGDQHAGGGGAPQYYLDDLRVTKGLARYTGNFTAPTTAHLTSAGDVNKQILINSAADGVAIGTGGINQARIAKAWCNINGTGTISIRGSYNVSSLTDVATGKYKVNFSTAMTDSNYVGFVAGAEVDSGTTQNHLFHIKRETPISDILNTAYIYVASANTSGTQTDDGLFCVIVFGN
mgnify:CR=1 FL=1